LRQRCAPIRADERAVYSSVEYTRERAHCFSPFPGRRRKTPIPSGETLNSTLLRSESAPFIQLPFKGGSEKVERSPSSLSQKKERIMEMSLEERLRPTLMALTGEADIRWCKPYAFVFLFVALATAASAAHVDVDTNHIYPALGKSDKFSHSSPLTNAIWHPIRHYQRRHHRHPHQRKRRHRLRHQRRQERLHLKESSLVDPQRVFLPPGVVSKAFNCISHDLERLSRPSPEN